MWSNSDAPWPRGGTTTEKRDVDVDVDVYVDSNRRGKMMEIHE